MLFKYNCMPLLFLVIIVLAACSATPTQSTPVSATSPAYAQLSGSGHRLFVFLSGFTSTLSAAQAGENEGYGSDPDFFGAQRVQPFLQARFPGSYFLTYSYSGFNSQGQPSPYACPFTTDSDIADLAVGLYSQD